jgi:hypothetical protein
METREILGVLHELLQVVDRSKESFRMAARMSEHSTIKMLFMHYHEQHEKYERELLGFVEALGGSEKLDEGSEDFSDADEQAIISQCEKVEHVTLNMYRRVIEMPLPTELRHAVEIQGLDVKGTRDKLKALSTAG